MGFMRRAGLYCLRQRFRTFLLFLVLTAIASFLLVCIGIRNAAGERAADVRTGAGGKIVMEPDSEGHMDGGRQNEWGTAYTYNGDLITKELMDAVGRVEGVSDYNIEETAGYYGAGINFQYLPAALEINYMKYGQAASYTATLSSEKCRAFQSGRYRLAEGRHIKPDDRYVCLISRELADYNGLSIGDAIRLYSLDSDSEASFEIIGIFDGTEGTAGNALTVDEIPANCGYMDCAAVQDIFKDFEDEDGYGQLTVFVEDFADIQRVYDDIKALPEFRGKTLKLTMDMEETEEISKPLESLQESVNLAIFVMSAVSSVILSLLLTIWIRGRKREIGILLSLGRSKGNIMLQMFTEAALAVVLSFAAALPVSFLTAEWAGRLFVSAAASGGTGLDIRIDAACLPPLCLIGFLLTAVSVAVSSWSVVRLRPKEILVKMS